MRRLLRRQPRWLASSTSVLLLAGALTVVTNVAPAAPASAAGTTTWAAVDAGATHACAITAGGVAYCWGRGNKGQIGNGATSDQSSPTKVSMPAGRIFTAISAGFETSCAVADNGAVYCWGNGYTGQMGNDTAGGSADTSSPTPITMPGGVTFMDVTVSLASVCARTTAGTAYCWGSGYYGELGNGVYQQQTTPQQVKDPTGTAYLTGITDISAGGSHACVVVSSGKVYCWGTEEDGELGDGVNAAPYPNYSFYPNSFLPVEVTGLSTATAVAAGDDSVCAVVAGGAAHCWGRNDISGSYGALGTGSASATVFTPQLVTGGLAFSDIAPGAGGSFNAGQICGVSGGDAYCWGSDTNQALGDGDGSVTHRLTGPQLVAGLGAGVSDPAVDAVTSGTLFSCALLATKEIRCWGEDGYGQAGNGSASSADVATPEAVSVTLPSSYALSLDLQGSGSGTVTFSPVPASVSPTCTVDCSKSYDDGTAVTLTAAAAAGSTFAGWSGSGCSGTGTCSVTMSQARSVVATFDPVRTTWATVDAGWSHACALTAGGTAYCWGQNNKGQLGNGLSTNSPVPVKVSMPAGRVFTAIDAGQSVTCAVADDGALYCWGQNSDGELGIGTTDSNVHSTPTRISISGNPVFSSVSVGWGTACAVTTGGVAYCWGKNSTGQVGDGTLTNRLSPVAVTGLTGVSAVAVGTSFSCARTSAGSAYCWGGDSGGTLGNGQADNDAQWDVSLQYSTSPVQVVGPGGVSYLSGIADLSAGSARVCAVATSGDAYCWGDTLQGGAGNGASVPSSPETLYAPALVVGSHNFTDISPGLLHTCGVADGGKVFCWGQDGEEALGDGVQNGTVTSTSTPQTVTGLSDPVASLVTSGSQFACSLLISKVIKCWGDDNYGQIGEGGGTGLVAGNGYNGDAYWVPQAVSLTLPATYELALTLAGESSGTRTVTFAPVASGSTASCTANCTRSYDDGTEVTLTASGTGGVSFTGWSGACSGSGTCTVTMSQARSVTATFGAAPTTYDLTVSTITGQGTVRDAASAPFLIDCTNSGSGTSGDCSETYDVGASVTLTASPTSGWRFGSWSGCDSDVSTSCSVTVDGAETVTATFIQVFELVVTATGSGRVRTVDGTDAAITGIDCGAGSSNDCSQIYDVTDTVTLSASAASGYAFRNWTGCTPVVGTPTKCTVAMSEARSVTAYFGRQLSVSVTGNGTVSFALDASTPDATQPTLSDCVSSAGSASCSVVVLDGKKVNLTASAGSGYRFGSWGTDCTGSSTCQVEMTAAGTVAATFIKTYGLTVSIVGHGAVASSPSGAIDCDWDGTPNDCTEVYDTGTSVTLVANAPTGWRFDSWSGNCEVPPADAPDVCVVAIPFDMTFTRTVTATFIKTYDLTVTVVGEGTVTSSPAGINCFLPDPADGDPRSDCVGTFDTGIQVTLTAAGDTDYELRNYAGDTCAEVLDPDDDGTDDVTAAGVAYTCTIEMTEPRSARTYFGRELALALTGKGTVSFSADATGDPDQAGTLDACVSTGTATCYRVVLNARTLTLTAAGDLGVAGTADDYELRNYAGTSTCAPVPSSTNTTNAQVVRNCTIEMTEPRSARTYFGRELALALTGAGTVSFDADSMNDPDEADTLGDCVSTGTTTCYRVVLDGTDLTLTADPGTDYELRNYAGDDDADGAVDCAGTGSDATAAGVKYSCTITMDAPHSAKTYFGRELALPLKGKGTVALTFDATTPADGDQPATTTCDSRSADTTCYYVVLDGTKLDLSATGDTGYELRNFAGVTCEAVSGSTSTNAGVARKCKVTMDAPRSARTYFGRELRLDIVGSGTVSFSASAANAVTATGVAADVPTLNSCTTTTSTTCYRVVLDGTGLGLTASGGTDYVLRNFAGGPCVLSGTASPAGVQPTCTIAMTASREARTYFGRQLRLDIVGSGTVSFSPSPANDATAAGYSGDAAPALNSCTTTTSTTCYRVVLDGTDVALTTSAATGWTFRSWNASGAPDCGDSLAKRETNSCTVTMLEGKSTAATFGRRLTVESVIFGKASGTITSATSNDASQGTDSHQLSCTGSGASPCTAIFRDLMWTRVWSEVVDSASTTDAFLAARSMTLTASASTGMFAGWADGTAGVTGRCAESGATCTVPNTVDATERAYFVDADTLWLRVDGLYAGRVARGLESGATYEYQLRVKNQTGGTVSTTVRLNFLTLVGANSVVEDKPTLLGVTSGGSTIACTYVPVTASDYAFDCPVSVAANAEAVIVFKVSVPFYPVGTFPSGADLIAEFTTPTLTDPFLTNNTARATVLVRPCGASVCAGGSLAGGDTLQYGLDTLTGALNTNLTGASATNGTANLKDVNIGSSCAPDAPSSCSSTTTAAAGSTTTTTTSTSTTTTLRTSATGSGSRTTGGTTTSGPTCTVSTLPASCYVFTFDAPTVDPTTPYLFRFYFDKSTFTSSSGKLLIDLRYVKLWHLPDGRLDIPSNYTAYPRCSTKVTNQCIVSVKLLAGSGDLEIVLKTYTNGRTRITR
ncbi:MAG: InlB B-repeat-containing protein [Actinomycetota bacterium]